LLLGIDMLHFISLETIFSSWFFFFLSIFCIDCF